MNVTFTEMLAVKKGSAQAPAMDAKQNITAFMRHASTEVTTHDEKVLDELAHILPSGTTVYVAHTPKAHFEDVVRVALKVQSLGFRASPHLVARRLPSERAVREGLKKLCEAGIDQALLVAGDRDAPLGPYTNTLDVIASDALLGSGLRRLGVAGHPEGHPQVDAAALWQALRLKQEFGARAGVAVHVATQFGFDPQGVHDWALAFAENGLDLPVHAGIAGPTSLIKLLRFAVQCGVGASLQSASRNMKAVGNVARQAATPEQIVPELVALGAGGQHSRIVQPHVFAFGGAVATAKWIRSVSQGGFEVLPDGGICFK
jgi:methylenetetrahydrofolate reductase (NADPH)